MSSAFKEHRFGKEVYLEDIKVYNEAYRKVKDQGLDKPLVFEDWSDPTAEDRALVYYKGAYVIYMLREQLGDEVFWKGIKKYTQTNFSKSVTTKDFQRAMEESANHSLADFFDQWVY